MAVFPQFIIAGGAAAEPGAEAAGGGVGPLPVRVSLPPPPPHGSQKRTAHWGGGAGGAQRLGPPALLRTVAGIYWGSLGLTGAHWLAGPTESNWVPVGVPRAPWTLTWD
jgi:hypothetical protein